MSRSRSVGVNYWSYSWFEDRAFSWAGTGTNYWSDSWSGRSGDWSGYWSGSWFWGRVWSRR